MILSHILLVGGWLLYGVIHSLLSVTNIKSNISSLFSLSQKNYRLLYNVIAFGLIIPLIWYTTTVETAPLFPGNTFTKLTGILLMLIGFAIMLQCVAGYFRQMSGVEAATPTLKTNGLNKIVRHPLYLGTFLFLIGIVFLRPFYSSLLSVVSIIFYTLVGIHWEEKKLVSIFGEAYKNYRKKTPAIIPRFRLF